MNIEKFTKNFSKKLILIEQSHLDYVHEILYLCGKKYNNDNKEKAELSIDDLQDINIMAFSIHRLHKHDITSENYKTKNKQFEKFMHKAIHEFGINVYASLDFSPFANPASIYEDIDKLLKLKRFTQEQIRNFFIEFLSRMRIPKQKSVNYKVKATLFRDIFFRFLILSKEEKNAILTSDENYNYSKEYIDVLAKYNIKKLPQPFIDYMQKEEEKLKIVNITEEDKNFESYKKTMDRIREINFLKYPNCLYLEHEYLNKVLKTDRFKELGADADLPF